MRPWRGHEAPRRAEGGGSHGPGFRLRRRASSVCLNPSLSVPAEFTTAAMTEGTIEGVAADYQVADKYATQFKFSRFAA